MINGVPETQALPESQVPPKSPVPQVSPVSLSSLLSAVPPGVREEALIINH